jgi:hypothetical protein
MKKSKAWHIAGPSIKTDDRVMCGRGGDPRISIRTLVYTREQVHGFAVHGVAWTIGVCKVCAKAFRASL